VTCAVFGVGNSQWQQTFQAFPKKVDVQLTKAGANRVRDFSSPPPPHTHTHYTQCFVYSHSFSKQGERPIRHTPTLSFSKLAC